MPPTRLDCIVYAETGARSSEPTGLASEPETPELTWTEGLRLPPVERPAGGPNRGGLAAGDVIMWNRLTTTPTRGLDDIRTYFDAQARTYKEQHGDEARLLDYRISIIRAYARIQPRDWVLEIGCGDGRHLLALAADFDRGLGVDLSPAMIGAASGRRDGSPWRAKVSFQTDAAERLASVGDAAFDVVLCVGALEHMFDRAAACRSVFRVLRPGGRFVCLTPNGRSIFYRILAPLLRVETRRLSSDRYLGRSEVERLLRAAGFRELRFGSWTFIQRGDMPPFLAAGLEILDRVGTTTQMAALRGGLVVRAVKVEPTVGANDHELRQDLHHVMGGEAPAHHDRRAPE